MGAKPFSVFLKFNETGEVHSYAHKMLTISLEMGAGEGNIK
jgi:hypothetical protein